MCIAPLACLDNMLDFLRSNHITTTIFDMIQVILHDAMLCSHNSTNWQPHQNQIYQKVVLL